MNNYKSLHTCNVVHVVVFFLCISMVFISNFLVDSEVVASDNTVYPKMKNP